MGQARGMSVGSVLVVAGMLAAGCGGGSDGSGVPAGVTCAGAAVLTTCGAFTACGGTVAPGTYRMTSACPVNGLPVMVMAALDTYWVENMRFDSTWIFNSDGTYRVSLSNCSIENMKAEVQQGGMPVGISDCSRPTKTELAAHGVGLPCSAAIGLDHLDLTLTGSPLTSSPLGDFSCQASPTLGGYCLCTLSGALAGPYEGQGTYGTGGATPDTRLGILAVTPKDAFPYTFVEMGYCVSGNTLTIQSGDSIYVLSHT